MDFELNNLQKQIAEINERLNKDRVISLDDLMKPVPYALRRMSYNVLEKTLGPFSHDFRIELRKRMIEYELGRAAVFPVTVQVSEGLVVSVEPKKGRPLPVPHVFRAA